MRKLIRATVPMCPKCKSVMTDISHMPDCWWNYNCPNCDEVCVTPHWGYYEDECPGKDSCEDCTSLKRRIYDALEYTKRRTGK